MFGTSSTTDLAGLSGGGKRSREEQSEALVDLTLDSGGNQRGGADSVHQDGALSLSGLGLHSVLLSSAVYARLLDWRLSAPGWTISGPVGYTNQPGHWQCGYVNSQFLFSALICDSPQYKCVLGSEIPSVEALQVLIDNAHAGGFDSAALAHLGQLSGTSKWIGATEIVALFRSFGIPARCVDFKGPSAVSNALEFTQRYFELGAESALGLALSWSALKRDPACTSQTLASRCLPLYFQWKGHSWTLVGTKRGESRVLVLDPACSEDAYLRDFQRMAARELPHRNELQIVVVGRVLEEEPHIYDLSVAANLTNSTSPVAKVVRGILVSS